MKKIIALSLILTVLSVAASAQAGPENRVVKSRMERGFSNGKVTRPERRAIGRDLLRYKMMQRRAKKDGRITPLERRRLHRAKCEARRELIRAKHNRRRRVI